MGMILVNSNLTTIAGNMPYFRSCSMSERWHRLKIAHHSLSRKRRPSLPIWITSTRQRSLPTASAWPLDAEVGRLL